MRYNRYKINTSGSFTVEAALIMPMIVGVIVLFIRLSFVCYDRVVIENICQLACIEAVYEEDAMSFAEEYVTKNLGDKLICDWDTDIRVYSDGDDIITEVEAGSGYLSGTFTYSARANKHFCPKY